MGAYELIKGEENAGAGTAAAALEALHSPEDLEASRDSSRKKDKPSASTVAARNRLVSLDVFRGLTVASWGRMIATDHQKHVLILCYYFADYAGGILPAVNHSPWNGIALADFVMPFFLFIVGVALSLTYKRVPNKVIATKKLILRASKLFLVGLVVQGGYFHGLHNLNYGVNMSKIRWMGVLQRIAIAYLFAAICEIWFKSDDNIDSGSSVSRPDKLQLLLCLVLTAIYTILLYGLYVPDWQYEIPAEDFTTKFFSVKCNVRGDTGPACNAVGMIDRKILGIQHLHHHPVYERMKQCSIYSPASGPLPFNAPSWCQAPFDPEGLLSSVMAIVTCLIGLQFGHVIIQMKHHKARIIHWAIPSVFLIALACIMEAIGMHINKSLYSVSYTCITAGVAGMLFTAAYVLVDVFGYRRPTLAMEWLGKHSLMVYILIGCNILPDLVQGFYWKEPQNNLLRLVGIH